MTRQRDFTKETKVREWQQATREGRENPVRTVVREFVYPTKDLVFTESHPYRG